MANKDWLQNGIDGLTFGERLGDLISSKGITQSQLANETKVPQSAISEYINGRQGGKESRAPDCAAIIALAKYFSVSTDYLLGLSDIKTPNLNAHEIHRMTGLTEENITSLINHGPYGPNCYPDLMDGFKKLINDLICYSSTHHATRTFSHFLKVFNTPESPHPLLPANGNPATVKYTVVAEVISGTPEEGVDYAEGFYAIDPGEYSEFLLDAFLDDLTMYLRNLYFKSDGEEIDDGND